MESFSTFIKEHAEYSTGVEGYEHLEHPITIIVRDNNHEYESLQGIMYELGQNDEYANVSDITTTEGNTFYPEQIDAYVDYIQSGGIIETFPVQKIEADKEEKSFEDKLEDLQDSDQNHFLDFEIDYKEVDELVDKYHEDPDDESLKDFISKVEEYFDDLEDDEDDEYHLMDMNHRFEAVKRMGITAVIVDVD